MFSSLHSVAFLPNPDLHAFSWHACSAGIGRIQQGSIKRVRRQCSVPAERGCLSASVPQIPLDVLSIISATTAWID